MLVLIPHPNQEAKIRKFQKELCESINLNIAKETKLFPKYPLWFEFSEDEDLKSIGNKEDLRNFAKKIVGVEICTDKTQFEVSIQTETKTYKAFLPLLIEYKKLTEEEKQACEKKSGSSEIFPMSLKIFQLGNKQQLTEHSQALDYFIWKKIN